MPSTSLNGTGKAHAGVSSRPTIAIRVSDFINEMPVCIGEFQIEPFHTQERIPRCFDAQILLMQFDQVVNPICWEDIRRRRARIPGDN